MPKYIKFDDVRVRVVGKVRFQDPNAPLDENRMSVTLANRLIDEAEGQVEMDLSPRYFAPFQASDGKYASLPDAPTKNVIRTLCELQAVMRILETDFGSGTAIDAQKYIGQIEKRYKKMIDENILAKFSDDYKDSKQWKFPPLPGLKKPNHNSEADDGFAGMVTVTSNGQGAYASEQIDDPSESFFNADFVNNG